MNQFDIVFEAITSRRSVRGFLPEPVSDELISKILSAASYAPSGSNIQPWKVHVVTGAKRDELSRLLLDAFERKLPESREYDYYPVQWRSPYIDRRRETGWGLYEILGIKKGDREASSQQHGRNYQFFGAPVVLIFTIDKDLEQGSWLDYGMFLQSIMIAARGCGLHTCPQAALANYPDIVKSTLGIGNDQTVVCGISMGYEDTTCVANQFRPERIPLEDFVIFHS
ncbi:nitroreductase [Candidimonas sp. SYP-B2681]|uniref:nitroreductase n=1 Tax=Candidimonas sp. SYP-B2681 TaxID=2497686 RepID=UPI000F86BDF5|nr:nitroreductase [Candidimonas sp. SYP-B2681]RTZ41587.1 nitroreductase [Candidimonas sp. SYP-B2681]